MAMTASERVTAIPFDRSDKQKNSRDKILVLSSHLAVEALHDYTNVVVSGVLTNSSDYPWNVGSFEVRYLDSSGKIVDADSGSDSFMVLSHSDHSFHLNLYSRKSIPEHASHRVLVRSATDPDMWFAGD